LLEEPEAVRAPLEGDGRRDLGAQEAPLHPLRGTVVDVVDVDVSGRQLGAELVEQEVEVGARRAALLQLHPAGAEDESPVGEEAIEIQPEDPLAQVGAVVILLRVAAAQLAREEDEGLAEQPESFAPGAVRRGEPGPEEAERTVAEEMASPASPARRDEGTGSPDAMYSRTSAASTRCDRSEDSIRASENYTRPSRTPELLARAT